MVYQNLVPCLLRRAMHTQRQAASTLLRRPSASPLASPVGRGILSEQLLLPARQFSSKTEYYYDSQSGKHVPVHDETHVKILMAASRKDADDMISTEQLLAWASQGISGVKLDQPSVDVASLLQGLSIPEHFQLWVPHGAIAEPSEAVNLNHVVYQVDYDPENKEETQSIVTDLTLAKLRSASVCNDAGGSEAMLTASGVASIVDATKGGDYVYLVGQESDAIVELAEELGYLDVEGPTLKARMVIDLSQIKEDADEGLEECLMMGINKFVIDPNRLQWMADLVQEQGKTCDIKTES